MHIVSAVQDFLPSAHQAHHYGSPIVARMLQFPAALEPPLRRPIHGLGSNFWLRARQEANYTALSGH